MSTDWARPVVHWEIVARDPERQRAFYRDLFNWDIGDGPIMQIPPGIGGPEPGPGGHLRQSDRSGVTLYVQVRDLRASVARATELGATVARPSLLGKGSQRPARARASASRGIVSYAAW